MKKYLLTGGLAAVLMLSACGNEQPEVNDTAEAEEENEISNHYYEELEGLRTENNSLQEKVAELEEENEGLQEIIENTPEETTDEEEVASADEGTEDEETEQTSTGEGTRTDPLAIGDTVQLDEIINGDDYDDRFAALVDLTVDDIIIGDEAYNMLVEENQFNEPAPDGYQWALIHATIGLMESETDDHSYYVMDHFEIVENDGSSAPRESAVTPEDYGGDDIYSGGTSSGYSSVLVPEGESFLIKYDGFSSNTVFFEVNQ